jgi:hypothetical protein
MPTEPKNSSQEKLVRTSAGSDTVYADGATVPTTGLFSMSAKAPAGKGTHTAIEVTIVPVDGSGVVQARSGTCTIRLTKVIDRTVAADGYAAVAVDGAPLEGAVFNRMYRIAANGGSFFIGVESLSGAPAGAAAYEVWARAVSE